MAIKVLLFDYDDVLTMHPSFSPISQELSEHIDKPSKEILKAFLKHEPKYLVGKISNKQFWDLFAQELNIEAEYDLFNEKLFKKLSLNKPLLELISKLANNYRLGVITDNYKELKEPI